MNKIKVLHVIKTLSLGGAETNLLNLARMLDREKFEVHVAYSYGGEIEDRFLEQNLRLFKYADGSHKIKSLASLGIVYRLARYILENRIHIVHTHIFNAHVWGLLACKLTGRKLVEHVHDFRYLDPAEFVRRRGTNRQYAFVKYLKRRSDLVLVLTAQNRRFLLERRLYAPQRVRVVANGIPIPDACPDEESRRRLRRQFDLPDGAFVILTAARMSVEKNVDLILRIAPRVAAEAPHAVFLVSGNGPLLDSCRAACRGAGLDRNVRFIGFHADVQRLLSIADLFLLPSFLELHSIALLEAMSMGVPVLISKDVGCHNDFVRPWRNGVLLDPFSDAGWAEAVLRLIRAPDLRARLSAAGRETCMEKFDIRRTAKTIEDIYVDLAAQRN